MVVELQCEVESPVRQEPFAYSMRILRRWPPHFFCFCLKKFKWIVNISLPWGPTFKVVLIFCIGNSSLDFRETILLLLGSMTDRMSYINIGTSWLGFKSYFFSFLVALCGVKLFAFIIISWDFSMFPYDYY